MASNELGQAVGDRVEGWQGASPPSATLLVGRYCRLERASVSRHAAELFAADARDVDGASWTYLPYGPFADPALYRQWLEGVAVAEDPYFFAVIDTDVPAGADGGAVGLVSLLRVNPAQGSIEVGHLHFSPLLQRRRGATEVQYLLMRYAFELGHRRYEWKCDALNAPSRSAATRLGFTYEGIFRQASVVKGRNRDTAWYSVTDREWPAVRDRFEAWLDPANFDDDDRQRAALQHVP